MRLPFSRSPTDPAATGDDAVQRARTRARRRLVGALVLLVAGVIGLPLLFDAQPRPLPVDTPIVVPARELPPVAQRSTSPPRPVPPAESDTEASGPAAALVSNAQRHDEARAPAAASAAGRLAAQGAAAQLPLGRATPVAASAAPGPQSSPQSSPHVGAQSVPRASAPVSSQASPQASVPPAAAAGRFVVQAGAYTDAATLRDARARVERLGLKTYTQVIETDDGKRTRVRIGPFATRDEASGAAARLKAAGLPANILALP